MMESKKFGALVLAVTIFTLGIVLSTFKVADSIIEVKGNNNLTVTGSAKKQIKSDWVVWQGTFTAQSITPQEAYTQITTASSKVKDYLVKQGFSEKELIFSSISTSTLYELNYNGMSTNKIVGYRVSQNVEIRSADIEKVTTVSRQSTELLKEGFEFQSMSPQYYYTKIADLKISMLAEATKDAKARAEQISTSTDSQLGKLKTAKMGVFQITPLYSTAVEDYGINDTSSIDKEITAVVTCSFELK